MTLPVSTSSREFFGGVSCEPCSSAMFAGVVRDAVDPAGPDDADPGAGQDADGVRVVLAPGAGVGVDLGGPGAGVPAVVGEGGDRLAEPLVAGPAELHAAVVAGVPGHRGAPGEGGDRVRVVVGWAAVAPLGEHLGGVDLTRPWQRREDRPARVLAEPGGGRAGQALYSGAERV